MKPIKPIAWHERQQRTLEKAERNRELETLREYVAWPLINSDASLPREFLESDKSISSRVTKNLNIFNGLSNRLSSWLTAPLFNKRPNP